MVMSTKTAAALLGGRSQGVAMKVRALRSFWDGQKAVEKGETVELERSLAAQVLGAKQAEEVPGDTPLGKRRGRPSKSEE